MKILLTLFTCLVLIFKSSFCQIAPSPLVQLPPQKTMHPSATFTAQAARFGNFKSITDTTSFIVSHHNSPNEAEDNIALQKMKAAKNISKLTTIPTRNEENGGDRTFNLTLGRNFSGNTGGGCPNDNTIALSNTGNIISGENSNYYFYDESGTLLGFSSMENLFSGVFNPSSGLCDPKVVFDSQANRFILFAQVCDQVAANSRLLLAFAKTANPLDGFYTYGLNGDPLNDGSSFDYPKMAVYTNEILVTGNLYFTGGANNQSVVYQIDKNKCYQGATPQWQFWSNISNTPFTIVPLAHGQDGTVGAPYNLVNTHSSSSGNTLDFYQITGEISATNEMIKSYTANVSSYSAPGDAQQLNGSNAIDAGDCRTMDGFYLNGYAHFVHIYDQGGWSGVRYNRLKISDLTNATFDIQNAGARDYSYPSICSFGSGTNDKSVLIHFCSSGPSIYPEMRAKAIDDAMQSNNSILLKVGESAVSACFDNGRNSSRWGDYSGLWRKPGSNPPVAWASGSYGVSNAWGTWIAEISGPSNSTNITEINKDIKPKISPNPSSGNFNIAIPIAETGNYFMKIISIDGKLQDEIEIGRLEAGNNTLKYLKKLPTGSYIATIYNQQNKTIANEKILVTN